MVGVYTIEMEPLTIRVQEETKESLESEADEYGVSVSEYVRRLLEKGRDYDDLDDRLESREERIETLESQLKKRSQIEEKIDTLATQQQVARAPWPVRWYRWVRGDRSV